MNSKVYLAVYTEEAGVETRTAPTASLTVEEAIRYLTGLQKGL